MTTQLDLIYGPGPRHRFDVYLPDADAPAPFLLYLHGGAWLFGDKSHIADGSEIAADTLRRALLAAGIAVVAPNYRLAGTDPHPAQVDDVQAVVAHVRAHAHELGLDASRAAIGGESAGGHLAEFVGLDGHSHLNSDFAWRAVVSWYGVSDLTSLVADRVAQGCGTGAAGPDSPEGVLLSGIDPADPANEATALQASPIGRVHPGAPPMLLLHGTADCVVPCAQSERLAAALTAVGAPVQLRLFDGLDHADLGFMAAPVVSDVVQFLLRHLA